MFLLGKLLLKLVASTLITMDNQNEQISTEEQAVDEIVYRMTRRDNRAAASIEGDALVCRKAIVSRILKDSKPTINYNVLSFVKECHRRRDYEELVNKLARWCGEMEEAPFYTRMKDLADCQKILLRSSGNPEAHNVTFVDVLLKIFRACDISKESIPEGERLKIGVKASVFQGDAVEKLCVELNRWTVHIKRIQPRDYLKKIKIIKRKNLRLMGKAQKQIIEAVGQYHRSAIISEMKDIDSVFNGVVSLAGVTDTTDFNILGEFLDDSERKYQSDILHGQLRRMEVLRSLTMDRLHILCSSESA